MTEWSLRAEVHPRVQRRWLSRRGLGQEYAITSAYPEQFALICVETVHGRGEESCVPDSCSYRYAQIDKGSGSRAQVLESVPKPIE